jgi:hypothetical protein
MALLGTLVVCSSSSEHCSQHSPTTSKDKGFTMAAVIKISSHHHKIALLAVLSFLALC